MLNKKVNFSDKKFSYFPKSLRFCKRAQFYILAVAIISAVVISLAVVYNHVYGVAEPEKFYDLSEELKSESARVIDYGVYNNEDVPLLIENFSNLAARNLLGKYPDIGFVFIYGDEAGISIENYGEEDSYFEIGDASGNVQGGGEGFESNIGIQFDDTTFLEEVEHNLIEYKHSWKAKVNNFVGKNVNVKINKQDYLFSVKKSQQFFMILMKKQGGDEYVGIK